MNLDRCVQNPRQDEYRHCTICSNGGTFESADDVGRVPCNVRRFREKEFTVWRCRYCGCLHCLENIDYTHYYTDYPVQRVKLDFVVRRIYASRLRYLVGSGLKREQRILDYGCGNGAFVEYLVKRGYVTTQGYDPYSSRFGDPAVLSDAYDMVTSQDVIEHVPNPRLFLDELEAVVRRPGGILAIGTPNAEYLDLRTPITPLDIGPLHQPYHRHLLTRPQLIQLLEERGFRIKRVIFRSPIDTWLPFLNSSFIYHYMAAIDGTLDALFESIRYGIILRSQKLRRYGLFGRFLNPKKDMQIIATAL